MCIRDRGVGVLVAHVQPVDQQVRFAPADQLRAAHRNGTQEGAVPGAHRAPAAPAGPTPSATADGAGAHAWAKASTAAPVTRNVPRPVPNFNASNCPDSIAR